MLSLFLISLLVGQLQVGTPAPQFSLQQLGDGPAVGLTDFAGRPVLLYFWTHRDPFSRNDLARLEGLQLQYAPAGLATVTIRSPIPGADEARALAVENGPNLTHLQGSREMRESYRIYQTPSLVLLNPDHNIGEVSVGRLPDNLELLLRPLAGYYTDALLKASQRAEKEGNDSAAVRLCNEFVARFSAPPGDSGDLYQTLYRKFFCLQRSWPKDVIDWSAAAQRLVDLFPRREKTASARAFLLDLHMMEAYGQNQYTTLYSKAESLAHQTAVRDFTEKGTKHSRFAQCWLKFQARDNQEARRLKRQFTQDYPGDRLLAELPDIPTSWRRWAGLAGNVMPGLGSTIAGGFSAKSKTKGWAVFATVLTYATATALVWDRRDFGSSNFLTPDDRNHRELVLKIELGAVATAYAINLITGFAAGKDYDDRH